MQKVVEWIRENGGYVDEDIYLDGESLRVRKEKPKDAKLLEIPSKCFFKGSVMAVATGLYREFIKGEKSFFYPFLATLPKMSDHALYRYTEKDIEPIFAICKEAGVVLSNMLKDLNTLCRTVQNKELGKYCFILAISQRASFPLSTFFRCDFPASASRRGANVLSNGLKAEQELTLTYKNEGHIDLYLSCGIENCSVNLLRALISESEKQTLLLFSDSENEFVQKTFQIAMNNTTGITPELHKMAACSMLTGLLFEIETKSVKEEKYPEIQKLNDKTYKIVQNSLKFLRNAAKSSFISQKELSVGPTTEL